jgi:hypothetical protein
MKVMQLEYLVCFEHHPAPFFVTPVFCTNPECDCRSIRIQFREQASPKPLSFMLTVDLDTWEELEAPERPPLVSSWAREFLDDCPEHLQQAWQEIWEKKQRQARRRANYALDPESVQRGALVSYPDVANEDGGLSKGGRGFSTRFYHAGREFLVEDMYCPTPICDCREVQLNFWEVRRQSDGPDLVQRAFIGAVDFGGGAAEIIECNGVSAKDAKTVFAAWCARHRNDPLYPQRYEEIKEMGRWTMRNYALPVAASAPRLLLHEAAERHLRADLPDLEKSAPRRNDACPCGSGKKYKRCCGFADSNAPLSPR